MTNNVPEMKCEDVEKILSRYGDSLSQADPDIKDTLSREKRLNRSRNRIYEQMKKQREYIDLIISIILLHQEEMIKEQKGIDSEVQRISDIKKRARLISINKVSSPNARKDFIRLLNINEKIFLLIQIY
jgi:hypothetical protein